MAKLSKSQKVIVEALEDNGTARLLFHGGGDISGTISFANNSLEIITTRVTINTLEKKKIISRIRSINSNFESTISLLQ